MRVNEGDDGEAEIARVWGSVLQTTGFTRDDDFFSLGGDSLLAAVAASLLTDIFEVEVQSSEIYENPTIAKMLDHLRIAQM
jgi:hypothetical protein